MTYFNIADEYQISFQRQLPWSLNLELYNKVIALQITINHLFRHNPILISVTVSTNGAELKIVENGEILGVNITKLCGPTSSMI